MWFWVFERQRNATANTNSNEAALSLRVRLRGTKRTARKGCLLSADVFQGASFGIGSPSCASLSNRQVYMLVF